MNDIKDIKSHINNIAKEIKEINTILDKNSTHNTSTNKDSKKDHSNNENTAKNPDNNDNSNTSNESNNEEVVGVYNEGFLEGKGGGKFKVPDSYSSKFKLINGDQLSMSQKDDKNFFTLLKKAPSKKLEGIVTKKGDDWFAVTDSGVYGLLQIAAEFNKASEHDEVTILVPEDGSTITAALDTLHKVDTPKQDNNSNDSSEVSAASTAPQASMPQHNVNANTVNDNNLSSEPIESNTQLASQQQTPVQTPQQEFAPESIPTQVLQQQEPTPSQTPQQAPIPSQDPQQQVPMSMMSSDSTTPQAPQNAIETQKTLDDLPEYDPKSLSDQDLR